MKKAGNSVKTPEIAQNPVKRSAANKTASNKRAKRQNAKTDWKVTTPGDQQDATVSSLLSGLVC